MQQSLNNQLPQIISLPSQQYPNRQFQIIKKIGQGGEGEVFIAKPLNWFMNMRDVALKFKAFIQEREIQFIDNLIKYQNQESQLPQDMRSQIVKVYERTNFQGKNVLIMELGEKDLYEWINQQKGKCSILKRVQILKEISYPIRFLHFNQMFHRDIKPENYLKVGDEFKLIDFGLIKTLNDGQKIQSTFIGSPVFQPPEIVQGSDQYSQEVDIWSLGATFVEVLTDNQFQSNLQDYQFQTTQDVIINPQTIISLKNLLKGMLQQEPSMRINIIKVIQELQTIESQIQSNLNNKFSQVKLYTKEQLNFVPQPLSLTKFQPNPSVFPFKPNNNSVQLFNQGTQQSNKEILQGNGEILKEILNLKECTNELKQDLESNKKFNSENFTLLKTSQEGEIEKLSQQNNKILETLQFFINQTTDQRIKQENKLQNLEECTYELKQELESNKKFNSENFSLLKISQEGEIEKLSQQNNKILETLQFFINQTTDQRIEQEKNLFNYLNKKFKQNEQLIIQNRSSIIDEIKNTANQLIQDRNAFIQTANYELRKNLTSQFEEYEKCHKLQLQQLTKSFEQIPNLFNSLNQINCILKEGFNNNFFDEFKQIRDHQIKLEYNLQGFCQQLANQNNNLQIQQQQEDKILLHETETGKKQIKQQNQHGKQQNNYVKAQTEPKLSQKQPQSRK